MPSFSPLFAYFGPETMMPVASIVATIVGLFLMSWRFLLRWVKVVVTSRFPGSAKSGSVPQPHYRARSSVGAAAPREQEGLTN